MNVIQSYFLPVSVKGQVTIPIYIRKLLGLDNTKRVSIEVYEDKSVTIKPIKLSLDQVYGSVKPIKKSFKKIRKIARDERLSRRKV